MEVFSLALLVFTTLWSSNLTIIIVQFLIRLIGADEHLYTSYADSMQWLEDTDVLEMIVDKFSSTVSSISVQHVGFISNNGI